LLNDPEFGETVFFKCKTLRNVSIKIHHPEAKKIVEIFQKPIALIEGGNLTGQTTETTN